MAAIFQKYKVTNTATGNSSYYFLGRVNQYKGLETELGIKEIDPASAADKAGTVTPVANLLFSGILRRIVISYGSTGSLKLARLFVSGDNSAGIEQALDDKDYNGQKIYSARIPRRTAIV